MVMFCESFVVFCLATVLLATSTTGAEIRNRLTSNLEAGKQQTIVTYGTSLTAGGAWVQQLADELEVLYPGQAEVINSGMGGRHSDWGRENLDRRVIYKKPDAVFIEFSINDAFKPYKTSVAKARENLEDMIDRILASNKNCQIILMVMNPPINEHLDIRPNIRSYNQMYRNVAKEKNLMLIDHYTKWQKVLREGRYAELVPDGIHPNAQGCSEIIVPGIMKSLGIKTYQQKYGKLLVVINGESNSGGRALNSQALPGEVGKRESVLILNNTTLASFDTLDIGVNNIIGHQDITDFIAHGFELELANRADKNPKYARPCYLVKTGQGSSTIGQWAVDGEYFSRFKNRVQAAKKLLKGQKYRKVILFSLGINDMIAGTPPEVWKSAVKEHFVNMRKELGSDTPIIMTRFMAQYSKYDAVIEDICKEVPNTYSVNTQDATLGDQWHWDYKGMKLITGRMLDIVEKLKLD